MIAKKTAEPLAREHMPTDYNISLDAYAGRTGFGGGFTDSEKRIPDDFGPRQSMSGFEGTYRNIIDYIVRITFKIWEERDVEYIGNTYSETSQVYDDYGLQSGNKKIIVDTYHTTGAFSDIKLLADEIIWAGDDEVGYHTSHRTIIRGTNDGDSKYGLATNRHVDVLVIANCVALDNVIFLEHVLYNNSSMLLQLGHDLDEIVTRMIREAPAGWPRDRVTWQELRCAASPVQAISISSPVSGFDVDAFTRENFNRLWNSRDYAALVDSYDPNFGFHGPTNRTFTGHKSYQGFLLSLISAFPDLKLQVDEVYWMGNDEQGYLTSERWSAIGTHTGAGIYGVPTGCEVQIWGITQHQITNGYIVKEWMLFNELDVMMQIAVARS